MLLVQNVRVHVADVGSLEPAIFLAQVQKVLIHFDDHAHGHLES